MTPNPTQQDEEVKDAEVLYPMWRWHLWEGGFGSYEQIEAAIASGTLKAFTCPKEDCDCKWPKVALVEPVSEQPRLKWDVINGIARIIKGKIERGEDPDDFVGPALNDVYEAGYSAAASAQPCSALQSRVEILEKALEGVRSSKGCWCVPPRHENSKHHSDQCKAARAALRPEGEGDTK